MPSILILSSHVAASPVGGGAQALILAAMGCEPILVPTVLFGRHPGLGAPGGGPVADTIFEDMLAGIRAEGVYARLDAVIAGYFASAAQVATAAAAIDQVRAVNPTSRIVVDPIMGDSPGGLYIDETTALAIASEMVSRADLVRPNAWELERLTGVDNPLAGARRLGRPTLVSSVDLGGEVGVIYADAREAWRAAHQRVPAAPHGTGDRLTALFTGALILGASPREALRRAVEDLAGRLGGEAAVRIEALR